MIEAGSKVNWSALESGVVDRIFFLLRPEDPWRSAVASGCRRRREGSADADAMRFRDVTLHNLAQDEFAVEAWLIK